MNPLLEDLRWRGLIHNSTNLELLSQRLDKGPIRLFCGFDPTSDSLHLGSLQMLMLISRFSNAGHKTLVLIGTGTGLIGDPSGKKNERSLRTPSEVSDFASALTKQIGKILPEKSFLFIDNKTWLCSMTAMELLRDFGKHFNINEMMKRDSVANRLGGDGMSFTEFSYSLLQAIDFLTLFDGINGHNCELQIGGSDQWGNMSSGVALIHALRKNSQPHALTAPLILNSNGTKFGKSESGTIWLDANKTSPMEMFQHIVNIPDEQAKLLLRQTTMLSRSEIEAIENSAIDPSKREIQKTVAFEIVKFVHGIGIAEQVKAESEALFSDSLDVKPSVFMIGDTEKTWEEVFVECGLASSKTETRRLANEGGLSVWDEKIQDARSKVILRNKIRNGVVIVGRGKNKKCVIGIKGE